MLAGRTQCWQSYFSIQQQQTQQEGPDISLLEPALQKQWDHAANAHLGNMVIKSHSQKEVWWTCDQCPGGYRTAGQPVWQVGLRAVNALNAVAAKCASTTP